MNVETRPLAAAVGIALVIAMGGAAAALTKQHGHADHLQNENAALAANTGGLHTLSPAPLSTPTPTGSLPPDVHPDTGVDLLWVTVPGNEQVLAAVDWSGRVHGRLNLLVPRSDIGSVQPSPDGQRLLIGPYDGGEHVFSAQGQDLGILPGTGGKDDNVDYSWAGDDVHVCAITRDRSGTSGQLALLTLDGQSKREKAVTTMHWPEGDDGARLAACNAKSDLAVVSVSLGDDAAGHVEEYEVFRLSTGAVLRDVHPPSPAFSDNNFHDTPGALWSVSATTDGRLLLLTPYSADMQVHAQTLQVVDAVSGRVLGHLTAGSAEFAGGGDDDMVVTDSGLVDWPTGHLRPTPAGCCGGVVVIRPGSDDMLVSLSTAPPPTPGAEPPPSDFVVLRHDGTSVKVACCGATVLEPG